MSEDLLLTTYKNTLTHLILGAAELIKATTKLQQYGDHTTDVTMGKFYDNIEDLLIRINDLKQVMSKIEMYHTQNHFSQVVRDQEESELVGDDNV